jgi:hypothetical protein
MLSVDRQLNQARGPIGRSTVKTQLKPSTNFVMTLSTLAPDTRFLHLSRAVKKASFGRNRVFERKFSIIR